MQEVSNNWAAIFASDSHWCEYRIIIDGTEYLKTNIQPFTINRALFQDELSIGNCYAARLNITIIPQGSIPRMAEIEVFMRLARYNRVAATNEYTGWIPKGVFYFDTREASASGLWLAVDAYDAMMKAEQSYLGDVTTDEWPKPEDEVLAEICARMDIEIDERTIIQPYYMVDYPNDLTMREVLGHIGVAHGGNWIVTDAGKLRLVPLVSIPGETFGVMSDFREQIYTDDGYMLVWRV